MRMKRKTLALLAALALSALAVSGCAEPEESTPPTDMEQPTPPTGTEQTQQMSYSTELTAPEGVETAASGSSSVEVEGESGSYSISVQDLSDINMAHIHVADEPGGNGPPVLWLHPSTDAREPQLQEGMTSGELASGTFQESEFVGPLEGMTMQDLVTAIDDGRAYVNVHTTEYPDGEISGFLE